MKFILGTKQYMTQVFDENGRVTPATVIAAGPVVVTSIKTSDKDGYQAVQVGFGERRAKAVSKAVRGQMKELAPEGKAFRHVREFRGGDVFEKGAKIDVSAFTPGDVVVVSGVSKGKGFQGVVKRHGFHGGRRTHGQKHSEREPGSIGSTATQRVLKGVRMGGRMGNDRVSVKNLKVVKVDPKENLILVSGAVPGRKGTLLEIIAQ